MPFCSFHLQKSFLGPFFFIMYHTLHKTAEAPDLVTFTEKLHFLCSDSNQSQCQIIHFQALD